MKIAKKAIGVMFLSLITIICYPLISVSAEINVLGQVATIGKAEVSSNNQNWSRIERIYPVNSGTSFRTSDDGRLSFIFKEGTRIEVGGGSEIVLHGVTGNYSINLIIGKLSFVVPEESRLKISTRCLSVENMKSRQGMKYEVSSADKSAIGGVSFDGQKTRVLSIEQTLSVKSIINATITEVAAGESVDISYKEGDCNVVPLVAPVQLETGIAGTGAGAVLGALGFLGGVTAYEVYRDSDNNNAVSGSPSSFK